MRAAAALLLLAMSPATVEARFTVGTTAIHDAQAFDALARIEGSGRFLELPQVMFAIDRSKSPSKVHWIDTRRYMYHFDYLQARYLTLADSSSFNAANYSKGGRRFILGSVLRYPRLDRYGVELWEGDEVDPDLLREMMKRLQTFFFSPLAFKPNSEQQRIAATKAGLATIGIEEAYGSRDQLVLNPGRAVGRLVHVREGEEDTLFPGDIAMLDEMPIRLPPVSGIISARFATPISHVNLLAKAWAIPNIFKAQAVERWETFIGRQIVLDAKGGDVSVRLANDAEIRAADRARVARSVRAPRADTLFAGLPSLIEQNADWGRRTGAKAANLGQVATLTRNRAVDFTVPPGFSIAFAYYERFVVANHLQEAIDSFLADPRRSDARWRQEALSALRSRFANGTVPEADLAAISARRRSLLGDAGVFVRSSTNAEDLPGFNGAGLYDTVPNVRDDAAFASAIKAVWGSIWNDRAFLAREAAGIDHHAVRAAVLVQAGVDADAAGVMTTIDPFDEQAEERRIFIAAKRGVGIRVVEGRKVAEQIIYRPDLNSVQILTRSQDDLMLHFAPDGGVQEVAIDPNRAVLTDDMVRRLAAVGSIVEQAFDGRPQDIEWLVVGGRIMIVQSRDYVRGSK